MMHRSMHGAGPRGSYFNRDEPCNGSHSPLAQAVRLRVAHVCKQAARTLAPYHAVCCMTQDIASARGPFLPVVYSPVACKATTGAQGPAGVPRASSPEERRNSLDKLIEEAAKEQQVSADLLSVLDEEQRGVLVQQRLTVKPLLLRITYDKLVAAGISAGAAEVLKMLFPGPITEGVQNWGPAPCGPPVYNLATEAVELVDEVPQPGCTPCYSRAVGAGAEEVNFVIDTNRGLRTALLGWLDQCYLDMSATKVKVPHRPLFLNGLTKTGKSYALNTILPAVLRTHCQFGVGGPHQMLVFKLSMTAVPTASSFAEQLRSLLQQLMRWLQLHNVPIRKESWVQAVAAMAPGSGLLLEPVLMELLHGIQVPVAVLLDEIQAWFLPRGADGAVSASEAAEARRVFKELVTNGPSWMLWAVTGSSMATFWINAAMAPKGGVALMTHHRLVNIPSSVDHAAMQRCWQALQEVHGPKLQGAELLYKLAGTTPALLVYTVSNWLQDGSPSDVYSFVRRQNYDKLLSEALDDWGVAIQFLGPEERVALYELSSVEVGVNISQQLDPGLARMLQPFTQAVRKGSSRVCLSSVIHRELVQNLVTPEGQLQRTWRGQPQAGSLQHLEAQKLLLKLGNAVVASEVAKWADTAGQQLKQDLQDLAQSLEHTNGPMDTWRNADWFTRVLQSEYNQRGAAPYFKKLWSSHEAGQQLLEPWQFVAQYSRMLRNCLGHEEFEDEQLLPGDNGLPLAFTVEDVGLVDSWPFAPLARIAAVVGPVRSRWLDAHSGSSTGTGSMAGGTAAAQPGARRSHVSPAFSAPFASQLLQAPKRPFKGPWPTIRIP